MLTLKTLFLQLHRVQKNPAEIVCTLVTYWGCGSFGGIIQALEPRLVSGNMIVEGRCTESRTPGLLVCTHWPYTKITKILYDHDKNFIICLIPSLKFSNIIDSINFSPYLSS